MGNEFNKHPDHNAYRITSGGADPSGKFITRKDNGITFSAFGRSLTIEEATCHFELPPLPSAYRLANPFTRIDYFLELVSSQIKVGPVQAPAPKRPEPEIGIDVITTGEVTEKDMKYLQNFSRAIVQLGRQNTP